MSILEDLAETTPVDLNDYIETNQLEPLGVPDAALVNRAASTALLTETPEQTYRSILMEAESGERFTMDSVHKQAEAANRPQDMKTILGILGDTSLDDATRLSAIQAINSDFLKDTTTKIKTQAVAAPSPSATGNESVEQEEVRVGGMEAYLRPVFEYRNFKQKVVSGNEVYKDEVTTQKVADFFAFLAPLSTSAVAENTLFKLSEELKMNPSRAKAILAPGTFAKDLNETITNLPPEKRIEVINQLHSILDKNSGVLFGSDNDFNKWLSNHSILEEGGYSTTDEWLDNAALPLDILTLGLFSSVRKGIKVGKIADEVANAERASVLAQIHPAAPANIIAESNPDRARKMYALTVQSTSDEAAKGLYGTTKDEALVSGVAPKIATVDGTITPAVPEIDRATKTIIPDERAIRVYDSDGQIYYTPGEKETIRANIVHDIQNLKGLTVNDAMTQVSMDEGVFRIKAAFGTTEGGFLNAEDAFKQARFALQNYGVVDDEIKILQNIDGKYTPVNLADVKGKNGDFIVQVDFDHKATPNDLVNMEAFDVKKNFFARMPWGFKGPFAKQSGSLQRWLVDVGSMFQKEFVGSAVTLADKSVALDKALLIPFDKFAKRFKSLPSDRQQVLWEHMIEANHRGLELSDTHLIAQNFSEMEIATLKDWRKAWDNNFWFENNDLVRTHQIQGYRLFENDNARFIVKPVAKNKNIKRAYDPAQDKIVEVTDLDNLYDTDGYLAKLRRPETLDGEVIEHMIVRNTSDEFARAINSGDQLLNYRPGYFQIRYTAPKFLERTLKGADGTAYKKVVAYGKSSDDLRRFQERAARAEGISPEEYGIIRSDIHELPIDSDAYWDLQSASGRIAQRHRGKLLEDASAPVNASDTPYILNPVDSAIRASRSLSERVMMRPFLETMKERTIRNHGRFFKGFDQGQPQWPSDAKDILAPGNATKKDIAAVRSTVEYINYLENGYINGMDEGYKSLMNSMANMLDDVGSSKGERLFNWMSKANPSGFGKGVVFSAYIGTNPLRQWIIQTHGGMRMAAYNPLGSLRVLKRGDAIKYSMAKVNEILGKPIPKDWKEIQEFIDDSGILSAVDRSNLVRGSLADMAEAQNAVTRTSGRVLAVPRKIGFDKAEQVNLLHHLLIIRDKFIQEGKNVNNKAVRDEIVALTRAVTGNMNIAGDMPYNQNWAALFMQFAQVPHKAITMVTNRTIPLGDRMKLAAADMIMYGVPAGTIISQLVPSDMLPEDSIARTTLEESLLFDMYNKSLSDLAGEDVKLDFSPLSPYGLDGWGKLAHAVWTQGFSGVLSSAPISNIVLKEDNRIKDAVVRLSRYTGVYDPYEGHTKEDLSSVVDGILSISSGWTNWQKAKALEAVGNAYDKKGRLVKEDTNWIYVQAQKFGFTSFDESQRYKVNTEIREGSKAFKEDVERLYNGYLKTLIRQTGKPVTDDEVQIKLLGIVQDIYKDKPEAIRIFRQNLARDLADPELRIFKDAMRYAKIVGSKEKMKEIDRYFKTDEERMKAKQLIDDVYRESREEE